jgi:hypothetical protein
VSIVSPPRFQCAHILNAQNPFPKQIGYPRLRMALSNATDSELEGFVPRIPAFSISCNHEEVKDREFLLSFIRRQGPELDLICKMPNDFVALVSDEIGQRVDDP